MKQHLPSGDKAQCIFGFHTYTYSAADVNFVTSIVSVALFWQSNMKSQHQTTGAAMTDTQVDEDLTCNSSLDEYEDFVTSREK